MKRYKVKQGYCPTPGHVDTFYCSDEMPSPSWECSHSLYAMATFVRGLIKERFGCSSDLGVRSHLTIRVSR